MRPKNQERKMEVYEYVSSYFKETGACPTTQEICDRLGLAKSTVSKYMKRLREEGRLERLGRYRTVAVSERTAYTGMPVLGSVACGKPKIAIEDIEGYLPIDKDSLGEGDYFGLIADGDSMIDAGISSGDVVYVRRSPAADDGQIVVALMEDEFTDGYRATLKRFFRDEKNKRYILHPENKDQKDIIVDNVEIVGVAIKVLKNL